MLLLNDVRFSVAEKAFSKVDFRVLGEGGISEGW